MHRNLTTASGHNNYINRTKEVPINTNRLNEAQKVWLSMFADELAKLVKNFKDGDDICSKQVLNVLRQIDKYTKRYPNPQDAAKAMSYTGRINHGRDEAIQRGEGVRRKRIVGQFPMHNTEDGDSIAVDLTDRNAIDPATQAADRDECRRAVDQVSTVVATGIALTAILGFDQGEAATQMGISRPYLSRKMKKAEREMRDGRNNTA
jgi:DNA-directed RNA polymerase specialized sigma24 family protein